MTKQVLKYPLCGTGPISVELPAGAIIVHCDWQKSRPCIWALVDDHVEVKHTRVFYVVGTGWDIDFQIKDHIATVLVDNYVWHIFEECP